MQSINVFRDSFTNQWVVEVKSKAGWRTVYAGDSQMDAMATYARLLNAK